MTKANKFLEDIRLRQEEHTPIRCPVGRFLVDDSVDEVVREGVRVALMDETIYATTLAGVFADLNRKISEKAVRFHRNQYCACVRRGI